MNTKKLIGRTIKDILIWTKIEVGGLDEAEVFIELDNEKIIRIPWDFNSENIEQSPRKGVESIFTDLSDIPVFHVNSEGKTIGEILEAKRKRESSILGLLKKALGITEGIPKEYKPYKVEYRENKLKFLRDKKIVNFLMFDDSDSVGFLELENGFIITEIQISPHGTGMAGINIYENLSDFEDSCGTDYKRLIT